MIINCSEWCDSAEKMLSPAIPNWSVSELKKEIERRDSALFSVSRIGSENPLGFYVLRKDGDEGVIVAAGGRAGFSLVDAVLPIAEKQFIGVKTIRIHTARKGLAKKLKQQGYREQEIVLTKRV